MRWAQRHSGIARPVVLAMLSGALLLGLVAGSPSAVARPRADQGVDLNIPWAIGGMRYERDGILRDAPGEWPTVPVRSLRLWDTRTAWLNLEPAQDQWDFSRLDAFVALAESHDVEQVTLVLAGTPGWAAQRLLASDAVWLGPGSASPPREMADWRDFVGTVTARYRGRIDAYEIWNEPTDRIFWNGTIAEWAGMVATASAVIRQADPAAAVIASGMAVGSPDDVTSAEPWLVALGAAEPNLTALSFHFYPVTRAATSTLRHVIVHVRDLARRNGLPTEVWVTEINVLGGASWTTRQQRAVVRSLVSQADAARVPRLFWYAWTDLTEPSLLPLQPGSPAARELTRLLS